MSVSRRRDPWTRNRLDSVRGSLTAVWSPTLPGRLPGQVWRPAAGDTGGMNTKALSDLSPTTRTALCVLGLAGPENVFRFFDISRPNEELLARRSNQSAGEYKVVSVNGLCILGVSFIRGESMTLLEENGTPTFDERSVSTAEYRDAPGEFQYELIAVLRADPVSEEIYVGLRALYQEANASGS